jgi:L-alanine-DL-glutamate epimerase-like enolase superfamily enzyme
MASAIADEKPEPVRDYWAVLSAVDVALWDLAGRAMGVPCYRLLGGARACRLDCYVTGLYLEEVGVLVAKAKRLLRDFRALKMKIGREPAADVRGHSHRPECASSID